MDVFSFVEDKIENFLKNSLLVISKNINIMENINSTKLLGTYMVRVLFGLCRNPLKLLVLVV